MLDGSLSGDVLMLEIMQKYGWDYQTYMDQPAWVLELATQKMGIEAKLAQKANEEKQK